jgi:hypothetical protein
VKESRTDAYRAYAEPEQRSGWAVATQTATGWIFSQALKGKKNGEAYVAAGAGLFATVAMLTIGLTHDVFFHNCVALAYFGLMGGVMAHLQKT